MNEQKKDAALDEETLEDVTGGGVNEWINDAWAKILGKDGTDDDKEQPQ